MKNEKKLVSPFTSMIVPDDVIRHVEGEEAVKARHEALTKPVTFSDSSAKRKKYLILFEIVNSECENERTFEFYTGTREELYWYLKNYMGDNNEIGVDVMKSIMIVNGSRFTFKNAPSIYRFMKDTLVRGIVDDPHPDIDEYYYEAEEIEYEEEE